MGRMAEWGHAALSILIHGRDYLKVFGHEKKPFALSRDCLFKNGVCYDF
jgi:hypothetical protein